jgi:glycosyltransferase involved in cell wall biosynthesis
VTGDAAFLVNPGDAGDIERALLATAFDEGLRLSLTEKGLRRHRQFSWRETAARTLAILESAAAKS